VRKLLAIVLMGGVLIVCASAAFANGTTGATQSISGQDSGQNGPWVDPQGIPLAPAIPHQ